MNYIDLLLFLQQIQQNQQLIHHYKYHYNNDKVNIYYPATLDSQDYSANSDTIITLNDNHLVNTLITNVIIINSRPQNYMAQFVVIGFTKHIDDGNMIITIRNRFSSSLTAAIQIGIQYQNVIEVQPMN